MNTRSRRTIAGFLLTHLLLGIGAAWLATLGPWRGIYELAFGGLVCGQVVLLGSWVGLTSQTLGVRIAGLFCGSFFVSGVIATGARLLRRTEDILILACLVLVVSSMIGCLFIVLRRYRGIAVTHSVNPYAANYPLPPLTIAASR